MQASKIQSINSTNMAYLSSHKTQKVQSFKGYIVLSAKRNVDKVKFSNITLDVVEYLEGVEGQKIAVTTRLSRFLKKRSVINCPNVLFNKRMEEFSAKLAKDLREQGVPIQVKYRD